MNIEPLISSPLSEPWTAWVMLALLVCLMLINVGRQHAIHQAFTTLFSRMTRTYGDLQVNVFSSVLMAIFRVGVAAMTLYLFFYSTGPFTIQPFLWLLAGWTIFDMLKIILLALLNYVFRFSHQFAVIYSAYANVWLVIAIVLFLSDLLVYNIPSQVWTQPLFITLLSLTFLLALIRWERMFCNSLVSLVNVLLVFVTIEIAPLLFFASTVFPYTAK